MSHRRVAYSSARAFLFVAAIVAIVGCGAADRPKMVPVRGKVTLDGRPLAAGIVEFYPERGRAASGVLQADGSFVLKTFAERDGAAVGRHRAAVKPVAPADFKPTMEGKNEDATFTSPIPAQYHDPSTSGLAFEVKADSDNTFDLPLQTAAPR